MRRIVCLVLLILIVAAGIGYTEEYSFGPVSHEAKGVSIIQLIANPERWHGKVVRVTGVLSLKFEGDAIYLSKSDYDHGVTKNAIWLNVDFEKLGFKENDPKSIRDLKVLRTWIGKYVSVEGVFDKDDLGHLGLCSGAVQISRIFKH